MNQHMHLQEECPVGNQECPVLKEVQRLKERCRKLEKLSQIDTLTRFFNFRYLMLSLKREMERTRRTGFPTGLIMIDLDRFKKINDTHGHDAGNKALIWIAEIWLKNIRCIDIPCRYGGDEFVIILPGTDLPQVILTAKRLRLVLEKSQIKLNNKTIELTASFGANTYRGESDLSVDAFIERTDEFLLKAKSKGRNHVCYDESEKVMKPTEITVEEREKLFIGNRQLPL